MPTFKPNYFNTLSHINGNDKKNNMNGPRASNLLPFTSVSGRRGPTNYAQVEYLVAVLNECTHGVECSPRVSVGCKVASTPGLEMSHFLLGLRTGRITSCVTLLPDEDSSCYNILNRWVSVLVNVVILNFSAVHCIRGVINVLCNIKLKEGLLSYWLKKYMF